MKNGVWHYTVGVHIRSILRDRIIKQATTNVPEKELPVVWFSTNPLWEPTANKAKQIQNGDIVSLTKEETETLGAGLYRIAVSSVDAPFSAYEYRRRSGVTSKMWKGLLLAAQKCGSLPTEWRVSFDPVPSEKWLSIERWDRESWRALSQEEIQQLSEKVEGT